MLHHHSEVGDSEALAPKISSIGQTHHLFCSHGGISGGELDYFEFLIVACILVMISQREREKIVQEL
jgi:hypothetical protein